MRNRKCTYFWLRRREKGAVQGRERSSGPGGHWQQGFQKMCGFSAVTTFRRDSPEALDKKCISFRVGLLSF